jgi:hypothetical protein
MIVTFRSSIDSTKGRRGCHPERLVPDWPDFMRLPVKGDHVRGLFIEEEWIDLSVSAVYLDPFNMAATVYLEHILTDEEPVEYAEQNFKGWTWR